jgi:uncharacterized membrane protein
MTPQVNKSRKLLKYSYGVALVVIGLDKVLGTNFIVDWQGYVSDLALAVLPVEAPTLVLLLGIAEILVGVMMLTKWTRLAAILTIIALAAIVINLLSMGLFDIAARDILIALGALVLFWLTDEETATER